MSFNINSELFEPSRYMSVISELYQQESATVSELDEEIGVDTSLEPEVEVLEEMGLVGRINGKYYPKDKFEDDFGEIFDALKVRYDEDTDPIEISEEEIEKIAHENTDLIYSIA